ncbi:hypothetical protein NNJEOMEG_00422 [Fundidesulfovibrio magnetotacticus]|uniref:HD domain-containing protein n=1 Tax=Fundidesulfovibrio magnetotacticus TaxID=2730080 RepID=A0A6V8LSK8_9BACT|nr:HD domain-containing protein [Fundidesulfovibrio magnetotacticus]GFK92597.1 hypothetical protein NNJEOMEG_00422 [Fundidesulfovibrio magnetotacticus]
MHAHIRWFEEYVAGFLTGNPEDDHHLQLKREHSLKVLDEARAITPTLGLDAAAERAAHLAALLHDAGRFPQYRAYKTFRDSQSVDHGLLGARTLRVEGVPDVRDARVRALVRGAVALHNRRALPPFASPELALLARIVRDADKLDIVRIMLDHLRPGGQRSDVVVLHLEEDPERFSPAIVEQIMAGRIGDYSAMRTCNDFVLLLLSWVHDLNFAASRRAFRLRGHADELLGLLPRDPRLTPLRDRIYTVLDT